MDSRKLAGIGVETAVALARRGALNGANIRAAVKGYARYQAAILTGDVADSHLQMDRVRVCGACENFTARPLDGRPEVPHYCGQPFEAVNGGTCGCLVAITHEGRTTAAGKSEVESESCPLGKW